MARRGKGIYKRNDGRWEGRYLLDGKYKSVYGHSYGEVKSKLDDCFGGKSPPVSKPIKGQAVLFSTLCDEWLDQKKLCLKQSSFAQYSCITRKHIIPYWGKQSITNQSVNEYIKVLSARLSAKTMRDILGVFMQIVRFSEKKHGIHIDLEAVLKPKAPHGNLPVLSPDEQRRLSVFLRANPSRVNAGVLLLLYTGIRIGELCALQWSDINLNSQSISVTKTLQRIQNPEPSTKAKTKIIIDTPKSRNSTRLVPLPSFLIGALSALQTKPSDYFLTGNPRYMEPRLFQTKFKQALEQAKVAKTNAHALRHTFATRAIEQNIDIKSLSEILGHSAVKFTLERYVHSSTELKRSGMERLAVYL